MDMIILACAVVFALSAVAMLAAAMVFRRGVTESKKPVQIDITHPEFDQELARTQMELLMGEAVEAFQERLRLLAQQNAELVQLESWLNQLEKDGDIDLEQIGEDAAKRVKALRIKKAEAAIELAESALTEIRKDVRKTVVDREKYPLLKSPADVKFVKDQEEFAVRYLETAQARLDALVAEPKPGEFFGGVEVTLSNGQLLDPEGNVVFTLPNKN